MTSARALGCEFILSQCGHALTRARACVVCAALCVMPHAITKRPENALLSRGDDACVPVCYRTHTHKFRWPKWTGKCRKCACPLICIEEYRIVYKMRSRLRTGWSGEEFQEWICVPFFPCKCGRRESANVVARAGIIYLYSVGRMLMRCCVRACVYTVQAICGDDDDTMMCCVCVRVCVNREKCQCHVSRVA